MAGQFHLLKKTDLNHITEEDFIPESDYSLITNDNQFLQFKYKSVKRDIPAYEAKPGIFKIVKTISGMHLNPTSFANDDILEELCDSQHVDEVIASFVNNIHIYKEEFGIETPKHNILLWGPPGTGKTTNIAKACKKYVSDGKTLVITWDTNVLEAYEVKAFINSFKYIGVEKIFVVAEDIGGIENEGQPMRTDASLLSLLDNSDKTFNIPVMVIATTNHPSNLAEAIANRSGRFDDKIEVGPPSGRIRRKLLEFFSKGNAPVEALDLIESKECEKFPPAHIRNAWVKSRCRNKPLTTIIKEIQQEIKEYNDAFQKRRAFGI